jgi:hypothetical protein
MHREILLTVTTPLDERGIAYEPGHSGKHGFVRFMANGRRHKLIVSLSPSDHRALKNARSQVRRLLRNMTIGRG